MLLRFAGVAAAGVGMFALASHWGVQRQYPNAKPDVPMIRLAWVLLVAGLFMLGLAGVG